MASAPRAQVSHRNLQEPGMNPTAAPPIITSARSQSAFREEFTPEFGRNGSFAIGNPDDVDHSFATSTTAVNTTANIGPSKVGTLMKQHSLTKRPNAMRKSSKHSLRAASAKGMPGVSDAEFNNVFRIPIPTNANPTEVLANRFQAWRKLLKDLITYFREVQISYEARSKGMTRVSNIINSINAPTILRAEGGLDDALATLRGYSKHALAESNKSREIQEDVITQLNGLRNDLNQKIKEIKSLAGDFRNNVDREKDTTKRQVDALREAIASAEKNPIAATGKNDPFLIRLAVERQVAKQIEEENYLHRAYLNLENSGRELESIVVGEIQKAYNALSAILKREGDAARDAVEELRSGPLNMPKDLEWITFVKHDNHFVDPQIPIRKIKNISYPGMDDPTAAEIRGGSLERKSKYLKSYTPGWYVLSPTHLHEFKSADHIHTQAPIMSLYLLDQKLGSHSQIGASSHKFSLKGRQTGSMHRGHSWVFRAESHEAMMAWYSDIQTLTEKTGEEKMAFVRRHARSVSAGSTAVSNSSGFEDDEADEVPYSTQDSVPLSDSLKPQPRPSPGGRFPSDIDVNRGLQAPMSPSSDASSLRGTPLLITGALPSEPLFAPKPSVYLTPERARASPTPERQRVTPTPDRMRASPSPLPRTTASAPRSRQVSRDEAMPHELPTAASPPSKSPYSLSPVGPNGYTGPTMYSSGPQLMPSHGRGSNPEIIEGENSLRSSNIHPILPSVGHVHYSDANERSASNTPSSAIRQPPRSITDEYAGYSERPHELGGDREGSVSMDRTHTASSSIYGAYDGPTHGVAVLRTIEPMQDRNSYVMVGPAPTFNQSTYNPLAETGLGISAKAPSYGGVEQMTNGNPGAVGKEDMNYMTNSSASAFPDDRGQPFLSRQDTANTVNTIINYVPGAFPRAA